MVVECLCLLLGFLEKHLTVQYLNTKSTISLILSLNILLIWKLVLLLELGQEMFLRVS